MILEVAILNIKRGWSAEFECAFQQTRSLVRAIKGYISHELQKCLEVENRYILLVNSHTLEDHT